MTTPLASALNSLTMDAGPFFFPDELLGEIFTHCDVPTLAAISRVSFACLQLTSKLLYTDVTLSDMASIVILLRLESPAGTPLPLSDRVSAHTSLSLIHSVTLRAETVRTDWTAGSARSVLGAFKPLPPALPLRILALSLSLPASPFLACTATPFALCVCEFGVGQDVVDLFNPSTLILQRITMPEVSARAVIHAMLMLPPWDRLSLVIQSGKTAGPDSLFASIILARGPNGVPDRRARPVRVIDDFLNLGAEDDRTTKTSTRWARLQQSIIYLSTSGRVDDVHAWVETEGAREAVVAELEALPIQSVSVAYALGKTAFVSVPSDRVRRLRDAFVEHGVRKDMDWDALDDL